MNAATSIWPPLLEIIRDILAWIFRRGKTKADKLTAWRTEYERLQKQSERAVNMRPIDVDRIHACNAELQKHKAKRPAG